jgi:hypothetical protein
MYFYESLAVFSEENTLFFTTEKDAKACYESSEARKILYGKLIAKLRVENKEKRVQLAKSVKVRFTNTYMNVTFHRHDFFFLLSAVNREMKKLYKKRLATSERHFCRCRDVQLM